MRVLLVQLLVLAGPGLVTSLEDTPDLVYTSSSPLLTPIRVSEWAQQVTRELEAYEGRVLDRGRLAETLAAAAPSHRDGAELAELAASKMAALVSSRAAAAVSIARAAERLASAAQSERADLEPGTTFLPSKELNQYKSWYQEDKDNGAWRRDHACRDYRPLHLEPSKQFSADVTRRSSSAHVPTEVFDCDERVLSELKRSEALDAEFRRNFANDASFSWQYFCSARGFLRHYPGASWESMAGAARDDEPDLYDCRLRSWYVQATGAPRDILIMLDATGSITNATRAIMYELARELLTAFTDDDHVNVIRFNTKLQSPISCFQDTLVPANHINMAAMLASLQSFKTVNNTNMTVVLEEAVRLLAESRERTTSPPGCQQALLIIADDYPENYTSLMRTLDPEGRVRVFTFLLGLGETKHAEHLACFTDGLFAQLISANDVTEQVRRVLAVLERPAVLYRHRHPETALRDPPPPIWTDIFAHIQDARWATQRWRVKENEEQKSRYMRLRRNKTAFLSAEQRQRDYNTNQYKTTRGHYSEKDEVPYQLMLSVAVPAFDPVQRENVTIVLMEEKLRNSTREYPVARLLGVAGVDLPLDDLRLRLPYHKLGSGGTLFLVDNRGNVVLHDDLRHVVEGDVLKPGYRTVDILDVELPDDDSGSREYSDSLVQFREAIIRREIGSAALPLLQPYDGRRRCATGVRHYHWRRVKGTGYTMVVSLPADRSEFLDGSAPPAQQLSPALAAAAHRALNETDFAVHPDWLYCRYLEQAFDHIEEETLHFLRRVSEEQPFNFEQLKYSIRHLPPGLLDRPYICDEELIAHLAWEANATAWFGEDDPGAGETDVVQCTFGSTTVFVATANGLTRWRHRAVAGDGPAALLSVNSWQARAASEPWYRSATAAGDRTLVLHLPVAPDVPRDWITAARALRHLAVTGFHFRADHLSALLAGVTAPLCEEGEECEPSCASEEWRCMLVDEAGWVLARTTPEPATPLAASDEPLHLGAAHPDVMRQLIAARVYRKRWLDDYQGACFPPVRGRSDVASRRTPTTTRVARWALDTVRCVLVRAHDLLINLFLLLIPVSSEAGRTVVEEQKRKAAVRRDYERVKFDKLYDRKVRTNRTRPATCDRRRAVYGLHADVDNTLAHQNLNCGNWSLLAARVPRTNLLLLAVYTLCGDGDRVGVAPVDNPLDNIEVEPPGDLNEPLESRLACWRHRTPRLFARAPPAVCRPHAPLEEEGYRQCWPPIPDKESHAPRIRVSTAAFISLCSAYSSMLSISWT